MIPEFPEGTVGVLITLDDSGPYAIPISAMQRIDDHRIVFALAPRRGSLSRLRADRRAALTLVAPGMAVTVRGSARVVADPLGTAPFVVAVEITADAVDNALDPRTEITGGIAWRWADRDAAARDSEVHEALRLLVDGDQSVGPSPSR